jgi:methionyl-tRNA formyltransferase
VDTVQVQMGANASTAAADASAVSVVAVTQSDPFFTGRFFEAFLEESVHLPVRLVEIVLLPNFDGSRSSLVRRFLRFYGPVDFVKLLARYGAARLSDRFWKPRSVEAVARAHSIPIRRLTGINDGTYLRTIRERNVGVLLSVAAPQIFRADALRSARYAINVHSGKLPLYRGMMPTFWALLNGEREVVVTVHEMVERLDAGAVLAEIPVPIRPQDSAFDLSSRAKTVAGREVARLLASLDDPTRPQPRPLDMSGQRYYGFPTPQDVARLRSRARKLL